MAHLLVRLEAYLFDFLFYPYMLFSGGPTLAHHAGEIIGSSQLAGTGFWLGFGILFVLSAASNVLYVRFYDATKHDWFGFETLRDHTLRRYFAWPGRVQATFRIVIFAYLSIWQSPLFATLWLRSRETKFAMKRADWALLGIAIVVANLGWTTLVAVIAQAAIALWR